MKTLTNLEKAKSLRETRKRMGWTQERMAEALNLDSTYLSQLENDRRPVDEFYISRAAEVHALFEKSKSGTDRDEAVSYLTRTTYSHLETATLQSLFAETASKLNQVAQPDRRAVLQNLRAAMNELDDRELRAHLSSRPLSADVERALSGSPAARQLAQESGRKQKAGAPTANKRGPASAAAKRSA